MFSFNRAWLDHRDECLTLAITAYQTSSPVPSDYYGPETATTACAMYNALLQLREDRHLVEVKNFTTVLSEDDVTVKTPIDVCFGDDHDQVGVIFVAGIASTDTGICVDSWMKPSLKRTPLMSSVRTDKEAYWQVEFLRALAGPNVKLHVVQVPYFTRDVATDFQQSVGSQQMFRVLERGNGPSANMSVVRRYFKVLAQGCSDKVPELPALRSQSTSGWQASSAQAADASDATNPDQQAVAKVVNGHDIS